MGVQFLDDAARAGFQAAVETVETASAVEVVIAVRRQSSRYLHANVIVGGVVAFAALAIMLFAEASFGLASILVDPFVVGLAAGALVELAPGLKRILTPRGVRHAHVLQAARAAFVERGVHNTRERSGLLVYISWLEQELALVPDGGLAMAMDASTLAGIESQLTRAIRAGGGAVATALAGTASTFAASMPRAEDDVNELPDAIDSDLARHERQAKRAARGAAPRGSA